MKIHNVKFKNFASYGNKYSELKFSSKGELNLVIGNNGAGKCLSGDTIIDVEIEDLKIKEEFLSFLKNLP